MRNTLDDRAPLAIDERKRPDPVVDNRNVEEAIPAVAARTEPVNDLVPLGVISEQNAFLIRGSDDAAAAGFDADGFAETVDASVEGRLGIVETRPGSA